MPQHKKEKLIVYVVETQYRTKENTASTLSNLIFFFEPEGI